MQQGIGKVMFYMILIVVIVFACIFAFKVFVRHKIGQFIQASQNQPVTVSAMKVTYQDWHARIKAVGSLRAIKGVDVTTEVGGLVNKIYFTPGEDVHNGAMLVQLYIDDEVAQLNSLQAQADLANTNYQRDLSQYQVNAVSKAVVDTDASTLKSDRAQVVAQAAIIAKKMISAPFSGRLGVSAVNPGQYVSPGQKMVTLQSLDPLWMDFYLPQQTIGQLAVGQTTAFTTNAFAGQTFSGKITTINPQVDPDTRNVEVEATVANPKYQLLPGMFTDVEISTGQAGRYLTLPQTAISYYPYGDVVYLIQQTGKDVQGKPILNVHQSFVTLGETRGDQVAILKGLKAGDLVVTSGQMKLKSGVQVVINNQVVPENNPNPKISVD